MLGAISLTNVGGSECELRGYLTVTIHNKEGAALEVEIRHGIAANLIAPPPSKARTVVLPPGKARAALIFVQWRNWCGADPSPITVTLSLPDGETVAVPPGVEPWGVEDCQDSTAPSVLYIGPVQPQPAS
jgi:hypothetical protein